MVRKSDYLRLEELLTESNELVDKLREQYQIDIDYDRSEITNLQNKLADAYEEQQRLFTVVSSLGLTIQNLERINRNRNSSRNFQNLQAESTSTPKQF